MKIFFRESRNSCFPRFAKINTKKEKKIQFLNFSFLLSQEKLFGFDDTTSRKAKKKKTLNKDISCIKKSTQKRSENYL